MKNDTKKAINRELVVYHEENTVGRDFVVGDIHNCYSLLEKELRKINFDFAKDRLFSVGDLFDRGPEPKEMVQFVHDQLGHGFYPVIGNHEIMFFDVMTSPNMTSLGNFLYNGGDWIDQFNTAEKLKLYESVKDLPYIRVVKSGGKLYSISHSEISDRFEEDSENRLKELTWSRRIWGSIPPAQPDNIEKCYVGHTIHREVQYNDKYIGLDTGSYYHNNITILEIPKD